jgi:hypothetical protein
LLQRRIGKLAYLTLGHDSAKKPAPQGDAGCDFRR